MTLLCAHRQWAADPGQEYAELSQGNGLAKEAISSSVGDLCLNPMKMQLRRWGHAVAVWVILSVIAGCGGGGSASAPPASPVSPTISNVSVACTPAVVKAGETAQCSATVQGTGSYNSAVTWSASGGTINSSGLFTASTTAGTITVTATSVENTGHSGQANVTVQAKIPLSKHVVMVMEENQGYSTVAGNISDWANLNTLIGKGALVTNYYADTHPSLGNYFMLTTGALITDNDSSTTVWNVDNLARRLLSANLPFKVYAEGITRGYLGGNTGQYVIRHNPFAMLSDVADNPQVANQTIWPFSQFAVDLAHSNLPAFSFIVPGILDDAHSASALQADHWLQTNVIDPLSNDPAFAAGGDGVLIVLFDEAGSNDAAHGGGHVVAMFWGPNVKAGYTQTSTTVYQHESMLHTVMDALGLQNPPGAAAAAPSMTEFFMPK